MIDSFFTSARIPCLSVSPNLISCLCILIISYIMFKNWDNDKNTNEKICSKALTHWVQAYAKKGNIFSWQPAACDLKNLLWNIWQPAFPLLKVFAVWRWRYLLLQADMLNITWLFNCRSYKRCFWSILTSQSYAIPSKF